MSMISKTISIKIDTKQHNWLKKHKINISQLVRNLIRKYIKEFDEID